MPVVDDGRPCDDAGTWTTWMITIGVGRVDCAGTDSGGIVGTGAAALWGAAAANAAALTAVSAPVSTTLPATPPDVHLATCRTARSRSDGR